MLKILQARLQQDVNRELQMFKLVLEKAEETEIILSFFEITSKYCISDSFVDNDGYSISSKGFLPTVVGIMVIWLNSSSLF